MAELKKDGFDPADFLTKAGLGRRIVQLEPKEVFFLRTVSLTRSSTFKRVAQSLPLFHKTAKRPRLHYSPPATLSVRNRLPALANGAWLRRPPSPPARRSR